MCILFISTLQHINDGYRLIIASNRDEFYDRPTLPADYWSEDSNIIGGRDLEPTSIGGTWLALNVRGRFAALLNINELNNQPNAISRGNLVEHFVKGNTTALEYMSGLQDVYKGFKLITVTMSNLLLETHSFTNIVQDNGPAMKQLPNDVKGFGNGPYIKVSEGEKRFNDIVKKNGHRSTKDILINELLELLKWNKLHYPDEELIKRAPKHLGTNYQKQYSSIFVEMPNIQYGTRTHTIILLDNDGTIEYNEWTMSKTKSWERQCFITKLKCDL